MPKGKKSEKSPQELEKAYHAKVEHAVQSVDKWLDKLAKLGTSRKYDLGDARKDAILEHIADKFQTTSDKMKGQIEEVEAFKLD